MFYIILSVIIAYLIGSIPTGYIFGKTLKGIDIREHGSGNVGATNVFRTIGKLPGIIVFVIDFLKGLVAVTVLPEILRKLFPDLMLSYGFVYILLGAAAIAGHIWTCFLKFKGGKGVAATAGVMTGVSPEIFLGCLVIWVIVFLIWRYVSLASIIAACMLPIFAAIRGKELAFVCFCATLCLVGVYGHRSNIKRLIQGTESKFVKAKKS